MPNPRTEPPAPSPRSLPHTTPSTPFCSASCPRSCRGGCWCATGRRMPSRRCGKSRRSTMAAATTPRPASSCCKKSLWMTRTTAVLLHTADDVGVVVGAAEAGGDHGVLLRRGMRRFLPKLLPTPHASEAPQCLNRKDARA
ncbi:hypothetical protein EJB05_06277, partial [Eragrostis curvula]